MWQLAMARDRHSVPILRGYAERQSSQRYSPYRTPTILADYIEDPSSILRRIREHDHDWMWWLWEAATMLEIPGADEAWVAVLQGPIDGWCLALLLERRDPESILSEKARAEDCCRSGQTTEPVLRHLEVVHPRI